MDRRAPSYDRAIAPQWRHHFFFFEERTAPKGEIDGLPRDECRRSAAAVLHTNHDDLPPTDIAVIARAG